MVHPPPSHIEPSTPNPRLNSHELKYTCACISTYVHTAAHAGITSKSNHTNVLLSMRKHLWWIKTNRTPALFYLPNIFIYQTPIGAFGNKNAMYHVGSKCAQFEMMKTMHLNADHLWTTKMAWNKVGACRALDTSFIIWWIPQHHVKSTHNTDKTHVESQCELEDICCTENSPWHLAAHLNARKPTCAAS